jgi:acyl-CoA dehydrogenase
MESLPLFGIFAEHCGLSILGSLFVIFVIGYLGSPLIVWTIAILASLWLVGISLFVIIPVFVILLFFNIKPLRAAAISKPLMNLLKALEFIPKISATERTALDAGVVWVEGDLFSGKPDFEKIMQEPYPHLTPEEKAFIDGPVEKLCQMVDPWTVWKSRRLPKEAWDFMKKEKFLGMIIPKEYGGLGFSALAHSDIVMKLSSRCVSLATTVMVPNSLGPAELLVHYGTDEQKKRLLPRLAEGLEIPCFALTEPTAGSDAGSIKSEGVLFKDTDGTIKIRLNWNKRYITLAAISTLLGMAFRLRDPQNLIGKGEDVGITCALIPSTIPGVMIGRRHDPLGVPFYNCPTRGKDVVIGLDSIIGGVEGAGRGWSMLMESLAAGRGISLPAQGTGSSKTVSFATSAYAAVRKQFGVSIGKFEGIEEPIARIAGFTYLLEAMRKFTLGAIDKGVKPPVITAISKYNATEICRKVVNDGMDVLGGAAISMGPRNLIGEMYIGTPIGITVEGANILTRTLIIFGQGALRAHPYAYKEVSTLEAGDVMGFDSAFWGHIGHIVRNGFRAFGLSLTRGYIASVPANAGSLAIYYRRLEWASASFAIWSDIAMGTLGGKLKSKEKLTGRFADILSWMYICTSVLRRYEAEGRKEEDLAYVRFGLKYGLQQIQNSFDGIYDNLSVPKLSWMVKGWIGAWSRINSLSSHITDNLTHGIVSQMLIDGESRQRIVSGIFISQNLNEQTGRLQHAMSVCNKAEMAEKKIKKAIHEGVLPKAKVSQLIDEAISKRVITAEDKQMIIDSEAVRFDAIQVDDFSEEEYNSQTSAGAVTGMLKI